MIVLKGYQMSTLSKLGAAADSKTAKIDLHDAEEGGLTEKIIRDLENNPNSRAVQNVNQAMKAAWGCELGVQNGQLVMQVARPQGR